jgi:hypothetical protein
VNVLDGLAQYLQNQDSRPPLELWQPELSGDMDIQINVSGEWFHEGSIIARSKLVKLFASILRREDDGEYYLVTPVEKWRIKVADTALIIVELDVLGVGPEQQLMVVSNVGSKFLIGAQHPLSVTVNADGEPKPVVLLEHGLTAKLSRSVFYRLVDLANPGASGDMNVLSDGELFSLGGAQ